MATVLQSATIAADGQTMTLVFDGALAGAGFGNFTVDGSLGGDLGAVYIGGAGTTTITFLLTTAAIDREVCLLSYSGGSLTGPKGNLNPFSGVTINNGSEIYNDYRPASDYKDSWKSVQNIAIGGFVFGPQRSGVEAVTAPSTGVRMRLTNPRFNDIVLAQSMGIESLDMIITVWADTLRTNPSLSDDVTSPKIYPLTGDKWIDAEGHRWIIKNVKRTHWDTQYVTFCQRGTAEDPRDSMDDNY